MSASVKAIEFPVKLFGATILITNFKSCMNPSIHSASVDLQKCRTMHAKGCVETFWTFWSNEYKLACVDEPMHAKGCVETFWKGAFRPSSRLFAHLRIFENYISVRMALDLMVRRCWYRLCVTCHTSRFSICVETHWVPRERDVYSPVSVRIRCLLPH